MKKLFSFLSLLLLGVGMNAWAGSWSWTWSEFYNSIVAGNDYYNGNYTVMRYDWDKDPVGDTQYYINLIFAFYPSNNYTYNSILVPPKGSYPISPNEYPGNAARYYSGASASGGSWVYDGTLYTCRIYNASGTLYRPYSGNIVIEEGEDGPYIYSTDLVLANSGFSSTYSGTNSFYIGSAAQYHAVYVNSNDYSMGVATSDYKSGYVYEDDRMLEYKTNSVYTLTATAYDGFHFVEWKKGSSQISTDATVDVTIDGDATYTAYFEPNTGAKYTISTAVSPSGAGTVLGAGTYWENQKATLTAVSANEHRYFFDHWEAGSSTYPGGATISPAVTGDATYTAVFRLANHGTITAVADHGTVTGGGTYDGGEAVTLAVTADDGYMFTQWSDGNTDNPRIVYVDGSHLYTAQFVEGVRIYDEEGVFEMGTSHAGYFTIRGDGNSYHAELNFNATILEGVHTYTYSQLDNSTDWSWIQPSGGNKIAITNAVTTIDYYGLNYRAAHLTSTVTGANGRVYQVEIYTNQGTECGGFIESNTMGFRDDGYGGWNLESDPIVTPLHFSGPSQQISGDMGGLLLKWTSYRGDPHYETINIALEFILEPGASSIPTGRYPINGTKKPSTVFIGGMNSSQFFSSYAEYNLGEMFISRYNNWVYRRGYVDVINKGDGTYYIDCKGLSDAGATLYFTSGTAPLITTYAVTFKKEDGTQIGDVQYLAEGASPSAPAAPAKAASAEYTYSFAGWESSIDHAVYASDALPAMGTQAVIYTATYTPTTRQYTLTWMVDGAELTEGEFTRGTIDWGTPIIAPSTNPEKTGYTFDGWDAGTDGVADVVATEMPKVSTTYTAIFTAVEYSITFYNTEGTSVMNLVYTIAETPMDLWTEEDVTKDGYTFAGWYDNEDLTGEVVTAIPTGSYGDKAFWAAWTTNTYTLTLDKGTDGTADGSATATYNSNTLTSVTDATKDGGWTLQGYFTAASEGTKVINADGTLVADVDGYTDEDGKWIRTEGEMTLYAQWVEPINTDLILVDSQPNEYYDDLAATYYGDGTNPVQLTSLTYKRTFNAEQWASFALPFDWTIEDDKDLDLVGQVYAFTGATGDYTHLEVLFDATDAIEAGKPYLIYPKQKVTSVTFIPDAEGDNPELHLTSAIVDDGTYISGKVTGAGTVTFYGTNRRYNLPGNSSPDWQKYIILNNNRLYYPNRNGSTLRPFRTFFGVDAVAGVTPRVRIVVDGQTIEVEELDQPADEQSASEVRKYVENGILIIERNGVKYNAQGGRL